jgi:chromosomal replication initiator protein
MEFPAYESVPAHVAEPVGPATLLSIQEAVCREFRIKRQKLIGPERCRACAHPRAVAMYLARRLTTASLPAIGAAFGGRDHSTVLTAIRKIERLAAQVPALRDQVERLARAFTEAPREVRC